MADERKPVLYQDKPTFLRPYITATRLQVTSMAASLAEGVAAAAVKSEDLYAIGKSHTESSFEKLEALKVTHPYHIIGASVVLSSLPSFLFRLRPPRVIVPVLAGVFSSLYVFDKLRDHEYFRYGVPKVLLPPDSLARNLAIKDDKKN